MALRWAEEEEEEESSRAYHHRHHHPPTPSPILLPVPIRTGNCRAARPLTRSPARPPYPQSLAEKESDKGFGGWTR